FDVLVGINLLREGIDLPEVTLVAIIDADKEGFLRSAWSLIQMIGRAARNTSGKVVMYADTITRSMRAAIDETGRRRAIQARYNTEHGIEPTTIVKEIHDINERLRAVAEATNVYTSDGPAGKFGPHDLRSESREQIEKIVVRMEADMRNAARNLEFERAASLRDEIQQIRLRVLDQDASTTVARAAEAAAGNGRGAPAGSSGSRSTSTRRPGQRTAMPSAPALEVTSVEVLPSTSDEPAEALEEAVAAATAADWLPGIRDEHEDDGGWQARWLERPTWDHTVTPNVIKRSGQRPGQRPGRRRRG
ncbi:MAG: UvrB/UvrC motif-containing protein, partial [Candidatus Limnocylindrales bacterium]